jgi:hypothetical protein
VNRTNVMGNSGLEQDTFCNSGLTRINVRDNTDVSGCFYRMLSGHILNILSEMIFWWL